MATTYRHGAYAQIVAGDSGSAAQTAGTLPVYFGVAPVHQMPDYAGKAGEPLVISSFAQAKALCGYSDTWQDYTLCEAVYAHYKNNIEPIGPIVLINVFNPDVHRAAEASSQDVVFANGRGVLAGGGVILKTIVIADKVLGTDYTAQYLEDGSGVQLADLTGTIAGTVSVSFIAADLTGITGATIIAAIEAALGKVYESANLVPTLLLAPGWSQIKAVNDALKLAADRVNGHWYAYVYSDIDAKVNITEAQAIAAKVSEGRTSERETSCWPVVINGDKVFHLSTLSAVAAQQVDAKNGGLPYETGSNKPIDVAGLAVFDSNGQPQRIRMEQEEANGLNAAGIRTAVYWGGRYKLWGGHTGAYGVDGVAPENIFDSSVRMLQYIANSFQLRYGEEVDKPMLRARIDTVLNDFQEWLDGLVAAGALLLAEVTFDAAENPTSDIIEGQFVFSAATTTAPQARSINARIRYTAAGIQLLTGGETA